MTVKTGTDMGSPGAMTVPTVGRTGNDTSGLGTSGVIYSAPRARLGYFRNATRRSFMQIIEVTQNVARSVPVFMRGFDSGLGQAGLASALVIQTKKDGASFATITPSITDRGNGWYDLAFTGPMFDTLSFMPMRITGVTGPGQPAVVTNEEITFNVTAINKLDGVHGGLTSLPNAAAGAASGLPVVGTQIPNATAGASGGLPLAGSQIPLANAAAVGGLSVITAVGQGPGGQIKPNSYTDQYVYSIGKMTSCRMRIFANKATADAALPTDADNFRGEVERFRVTASYNTDGTLKTYEFAKEL